MVSRFVFISEGNLIIFTLIFGEKPCGNSSWINSDDVNNLANMRMMFLVCSSGQRKSSALMIFSSSVPTANS